MRGRPPINSYVERLRRYRHSLAVHRKMYLRHHPDALMNNRRLNSYVERLRSRRRRLRKLRRLLAEGERHEEAKVGQMVADFM